MIAYGFLAILAFAVGTTGASGIQKTKNYRCNIAVTSAPIDGPFVVVDNENLSKFTWDIEWLHSNRIAVNISGDCQGVDFSITP
jgi:hypothetical protein